MAGRLLEAGHRVTVWNRSAGKAEARGAGGGQPGGGGPGRHRVQHAGE
nr:NAD(P)-binding domain-containing protein [Roseomonas gilardii]